MPHAQHNTRTALTIVTVLIVLGAPTPAARAADASDDLQIRFNLAPEFTWGDRRFKIIGRLQLDATAADTALSGASGSYDGSEVRRGRIGVEGRDGPLGYRAEVTIDEGDALWEDAWIQYDLGGVTVIGGHWKEPVSLDQQTSSRHSAAMERAAFTNAFGFGRRLGVGVSVSGDNHTFRAGVFGDNVNDPTGASDEGTAAAARVTFNPISNDARIIHVGASAMVRDAGDAARFRYRARPQIDIGDRFVDTTAFAESDAFVGVEAAALSGPWHVEAEYGVLDADGPVADATFQGGYLAGGVFLTPGDAQGYSGGAFNRTRPKRAVTDGGGGAWELRGRVDWLDLEDGAVLGGTQTAYTVGVNWYATDYLRFLSEVSHAQIEDGPSGSGDVQAVSVRGAIDW